MANDDRGRSFQTYGMPSAILSDGLVPVPLWVVSAININAAYTLPPIGSTASRVLVDTHHDTISLNGLLVGPDRYVWKLALETIAESGKRGGAGLVAAASSLLGVDISGLILITAMTIRTDMQIQQLSFSANSQRRDAIEVSIQLAHLPPPGARAKLLDMASVAVSSLAGW